MGRISGNVIGDLTRVLRWGTASGDGDDRLLERFLEGRDESAFTALVARHGPMVLGVCRRVLRDEHDVEDAFQATFLVLVRSAGAIRRGELVGPWLHGVAHRVAVRARAGAARRFVRERNGMDVQAMAVAADARNSDHAELRAILDAELARLPEALRAPLVLCYLEGLTHEQAAGRLQAPVGTIRSRLARGRDRLRARLARRGVSADDSAWGSMVLAEPISTRLFEATVRSVLDSTLPGAAATALVSATAASLAKGVLDAMLMTKLKLAGACALGLALTMGGVSGYTFQQATGPGKTEINDESATRPTGTPKSSKTSESNPPALLQRKLDEIQMELIKIEERRQEDLERVRRILDSLSTIRSQVQHDEPVAPLPEATPAANLAENQKADETEQAEYLDPNQPIVVPSQGGRVVTIFGVSIPTRGGMTGYVAPVAGVVKGKLYSNPLSVRLAADGDPRLDVASVAFNPISRALVLRGERIQRLAIFNMRDARWDVQDLREPVKEATPVGCHMMTTYALGRRLYTYSNAARKWSVLELPEGAAPEAKASDQGLTLRYGDKIHIYDVQMGEWTDFDLQVTPEGSKKEQ